MALCSLALTTLTAAGLALPAGGASRSAAGAPPARVAQAERPLTVMTFNIWYGGVQVDFGQIARSIRQAGADVVGVQETEGNLRGSPPPPASRTSTRAST